MEGTGKPIMRMSENCICENFLRMIPRAANA